MIPRRIANATKVLGAPADWDQSKGKCGGLAIRIVETTQGIACESAWEPTPAELEMLNNGGSVVLRVMGWQVPVALDVEAAAVEVVE